MIRSAIVFPPAAVSLALVLRRLKALRLPILCVATGLALASSVEADDAASVPSWRQGVSQWSGSGYELPAQGVSVAANPAAAETGNSLPYTMPVDPNATVSSDNPYFELPAADDIGPFGLTVDPAGNNLPSASAAPFAPPNASYTSTPAPYTVGSGADTTNTLPLTDAAGSPTSDAANFAELPPPADATRTARDGDATIGDQLASGEGAESTPLEAEVTRWYHYPRQWMRGWDSHAELGLDGSNGNADTLALQTGLELKRKTDRSTFAIDVDYRQASSRNVTVEDSGRFNVDYDYLFKGSPWAGFSKLGLEWDKFKAFDLRLNVNGGIGYHWIRQDDATLVTRFGAGASNKFGAPVEEWIAEAVFGIEASRQLTARQKLLGKVDYFPQWEDFDEFRLVSDFAWEILLDGSENLSLRLAATDRYDSSPQGAKPNDVYYSLLLLYKF